MAECSTRWAIKGGIRLCGTYIDLTTKKRAVRLCCRQCDYSAVVKGGCNIVELQHTPMSATASIHGNLAWRPPGARSDGNYLTVFEQLSASDLVSSVVLC